MQNGERLVCTYFLHPFNYPPRYDFDNVFKVILQPNQSMKPPISEVMCSNLELINWEKLLQCLEILR